MTGWDNQDLRALRLIGAGLGAFQTISIEENSMTDQTPEQEPDGDWDSATPVASALGGATFPEYPYSLADHAYTWSPKFPDGSMMVIRAQSAEDLADRAEALIAISGRLRAAWGQATGAGAPQQPMPPQGGAPAWQTPQTPPPFGQNVSVPGAPGYAGPPAPQMPQQQGWGQQPPQGGQQAQRKEYPAPQGWYKLNGAQKPQVDAIAAQYSIPKGNPSKGGKYNFFGLTPSGQPGKAWYCAPEVARAFGQFGPVSA